MDPVKRVKAIRGAAEFIIAVSIFLSISIIGLLARIAVELFKFGYNLMG